MKQFNMNNIANRMMKSTFTKVDNLVWSLTTGALGVVNGDSGVKTLTFLKAEDGSLTDYSISESLFEVFGMPIPAYAMRASINDIVPSSLVVANGITYWVVAKKGNLLKVLSPDGLVSELASTSITGFDGNAVSAATFMLVKPLIDVLGGNEGNLSNFSSNLMPMMMMSQMSGGNDFDMERMIPFMLMSGGSLGGSNSMMSTMMMLQMMKGGNSFFP